MVSDEAGRLGGKHGGSSVEGKGLVVGAFTNVLVSSTSSKHVQQAFFDRVGDGGRVLGLSFGEQQVEDGGRVQLSGWVVGGVTWAEGSVRVNAKWCKNSIEVSGFSVGGSFIYMTEWV